MKRCLNTTTSLLAIALLAASLGSVCALADAPTTRPAKPPKAALPIKNRDTTDKPLTAAQTRALDLPPLADTPSLPALTPIVLPEKPRHKLDPRPERPFLLPAMGGRPRWATFMPAPGVHVPSVLDGNFAPMRPMIREYIPDAAPTGLTPDVNLDTRAEFDGINDDDPPAIRTDLPSRPAIPG